MAKPLRVGIIGLSAERGWAATAHVPALRAVPGLELAGLCASTRESGARAAQTHGVEKVFDSPEQLVADEGIDLAVVTVKVSRHHELVSAAIDAGKPILCEWPLGNGLAEAVELQDRADNRGLLTAVGLQAWSAPAVAHLADVVASGEIGEVLSTTVLASGSTWGATVESDQVYLLDPKEGASLLTIPFGHTAAGMERVLGPLARVQSTMATRRTTVVEVPAGTTHQQRVADQLLVSGVLASGAPASIHYRGGMSKGTNFHWEINGSDGDIVVTGTNGHLQFGQVRVAAARRGETELQPLQTPGRYQLLRGIDPTSPAYTVAHAYLELAKRVQGQPSNIPDFSHGVRQHRVLAAIERSAAEGLAVTVSPDRKSARGLHE